VGGGMMARGKGWATATFRLRRPSPEPPTTSAVALFLPITIRKNLSQGRGILDFISSPAGAGRSCQSEDRRSVSSFTQAHLHMCDRDV
jgi:hypothetical protein